MREIKFRIWGHTKQRVELVKYLLIEGSKIKHKYETEKAESYFSNPIIEQYTGLKDINGKEIYEGDIIKSYDCRPGDVLFFGGAFNVSGWDESLTMEYQMDDTCEIIGNIHENKYLLK